MLAGLVGFVLARAPAAQAAGVVGNGTPGSCTETTLAQAMNSGSGDISFNCGPNPVIITITQNGGLNAIPGSRYTIDGGNMVTLSGGGARRIFDVRVNAALTLSNIILTDGHAFSGGNLPDLGGAILAEGYRLVLDNVVIRNSQSATTGGAIKLITGTAIIMNSLIEGNQSGDGGGIDSGGSLSLINTLTLSNTTVRSNRALNYFGGGLLVSGTVSINNSRIDNNSAGVYGGGIFNTGALTLNSSGLNGNSATNVNSSQVTQGGGIYNSHGSLVMSNCTLDSNLATDGGGGISSYAGALMLTNCVLNGNSTTDGGGGGINSKLGPVELYSSTLSANSSNYGGGIYLSFGSRLDTEHSIFSGNHASGDGGGIYIDNNSELEISYVSLNGNSANRGGAIFSGFAGFVSHSTLSGNHAMVDGGGIFIDSGSYLDIAYSTLNGNSAIYGGGILSLGTATLLNSTISGNPAQQQGGGFYNGSELEATNATFSNNSAASGGALFMANGETTYLTNTLLAYSPSGGNCNGSVSGSKYSLSSDNTCVLSGTGDQNNVDPLNTGVLLTALGNYGGPTPVHMLKPGSPAIDAVAGSDAPADDQRGVTRPQGGGFDIGAVERKLDDSDLAPSLYLPLVRR